MHLNKKEEKKKKRGSQICPPALWEDDEDASRSRASVLSNAKCPMLPKSDEEEEEDEDEENNARPPCGVCRTRGRRRWVGKDGNPTQVTTCQGRAKRINIAIYSFSKQQPIDRPSVHLQLIRHL